MVATRSTSKRLNASKKIFHGTPNSYRQKFRMGDNFSNVIIKAGILSIRSHKCVLKTLSPYYQRMFTHPLKENNTDVVVHKGQHDAGTIISLIDMAYSNQLTVDSSNVQDIIVAADYLRMDDLKLFCEEFMGQQLYTSNALGFHQFGEFFCFKNLLSRADKYIASNFVEITSTKEFLSLDKDRLVTLISRSDLKVKVEEEVFEACKRWVNENSQIRSQSIFEVLQQVRVALIKPDYLAKVIATFPACKSSTECQQRITNVALYHSSRSKRIKYDVGEVKPRGFRSGKMYTFGKDSFASCFNGKFEYFFDKNTREQCYSKLAVLNGTIYLTGGYRLDPDDEDNRMPINDVYAFAPDKKDFKALAPMNYNRIFHGCCSHAGGLFVCGGKEHLASTCCEYFNIQDNKWKFVAEMSEKRVVFEIVSCGKFIWAIGGWSVNGTLNSTEYYDDVTDKWTKSTPMLEKRAGHSAVAFREQIFIIGGANADHLGGLRTAEVLDTKTKQFTALKPMLKPRYFVPTAINEHKLYCFGGRRLHGEWFKSVESFNLYSGEWEKEENMNEFDHGYSAVTVYDY